MRGGELSVRGAGRWVCPWRCTASAAARLPRPGTEAEERGAAWGPPARGECGAAVGPAPASVSVLARVGFIALGRQLEVSALRSGERSGEGGGARARPPKFLVGV